MRSFGSAHASASPKLCEMTPPRLWSTAYLVTLKMSASWLVLARTRSMFAPGAIACAHSTSSEISDDHPTWLGSLTMKGVKPSGAMMLRLGGAGHAFVGGTVVGGTDIPQIPQTAFQAARSVPMLGLEKASMMTIVWPAPLVPPSS